jgi:hypothetical protein
MTNTTDSLDPSETQPEQTTKLQLAPQPQAKKGWTGFAGKTLWDWLNLLGVFLIPVVIGAASIWFGIQQNATSQIIAADQERATTLKAYMDDMTGLLLHEGLRESKEDASVRVIARAKTLVALTQLDGERKGTLLRFLKEARLIGSYNDQGNRPINSIIYLRSADLRGANLSLSYLFDVDLSGANLSGANLSVAALSRANLSGANLSGVNLSRADLSGANLSLASLRGADLRGADLREATIWMIDPSGTKHKRTYPNSNLWLADLIGANLSGAKVTPEQLARTSTLKDATLPDGSHYPSASYPIPHH